MTCQLCQQETTTETVEGYDLCPNCAAKVRVYAQRLTTRLERLEQRAERNKETFHQLYDRAHDMASVIPFGQPILIGHHSENRDRRYRERITSTFRKAFEHYEKAQALERRAQAVQDHSAISSDDPLALLKLRNEVAELEALQAHMKAVNACIRQYSKQGVLAQRDALMQQFGMTEDQTVRLLSRDDLGRIGYPDYRMKNNNANIRRVKDRIAELEAKIAQATQIVKSEMWGDVELVRDTEANRLRLHFPGKPDAETIKLLKSRGFVWSPSNKAWQRQLNNGTEYAAKFILEQLGKQPSHRE